MKTAKEEVRATLDRFADDASMDAILAELYFKAKILRSRAQAARGELTPNEEVMEDLQRWLQSLGHQKPEQISTTSKPTSPNARPSMRRSS